MTRRFLLLMGLGILGLILNHSATFGYRARVTPIVKTTNQ